MKNTIIAVLSVTTLALGALTVRQWRALQNVNKAVTSTSQSTTGRLHAKQPRSSPVLEDSRAGSTAPVGERAVDNSHPPKDKVAKDVLAGGAKTPLESEIHRPTAGQENPAAAAKTPTALSVPASPLAGYAEAAKTPAAQDAKRAEAKASLEQSHGALFKALSLSPEQLDAFKDLLVEKNMAAQDNGTALMSGQTVFDIGKAATTRDKENEDKLRSLLGDDHYAFYKQFEDTQQEREKVELFKNSRSSPRPWSSNAPCKSLACTF